MSWSRSSLAALGLGCLIACSPILPRAEPPAVENMPPPAFLYLVGDPPTAARPFVVSFAGEDGDRGGQTFAFLEGQAVVIDRTSNPGPVSAWVDDVACAGTLRTVAERHIDGTLTVGDDTCTLVATGNHPLDEDLHPDLNGSLSAEAPLGSVLTLTSLDGAIPGEVSGHADESGWVSALELPAGRWQAVLSLAGDVLHESELSMEAGKSIHLDLREP